MGVKTREVLQQVQHFQDNLRERDKCRTAHSGTQERNNMIEEGNLKGNSNNNERALDPYVRKRKSGTKY
jgi:hypothetical protein